MNDQTSATDPEDFKNSQTARRLTGQRNPERNKARRSRRKERVVVLGDSQVKYIKGENLTTSQTQVTVKSISALRAEQVTSRFSREIESGINDRVIIHVGTNNVQSDSIEEITNKFISLANNLSQTYKNVTFWSIIRRKDKPYLNDKIDVVNKKLYDICVSAGVYR